MTQRPLTPTPLLLAVLVLLWEAPMHPYQMQRLMKERAKDFVTDIKPGSIYNAVQRLERAGLAEAVETTREGKRPERTTYRITEEGRETCEEWVRMMLRQLGPEHPDFIAALSSVSILPPEQAQAMLAERLAKLETEIDSLRAGLRLGEEMKLPRVLVLEGEFMLAVREAEVAWIRGVIDDLASTDLSWSAEELVRFAEQFRKAQE